MDTKILRQKILDLAIHGRLVPQDPNDEPASALLARIRAEKEQLVKDGKLKKKDLVTTPVSDEDKPFEVPEGWEWCRLQDISEIVRGGSPRPIKNYLTDSPEGLNWIKIGDTEKGGKYIRSAKEKIIKEGLAKTRFIRKGTFLLTNSMSFGRPYITLIDGCIHDGWLAITPKVGAFIEEYLYYLLSSSFVFDQFSQAAAGAVVQNLNSDKVAVTLIPLPPLAEQQRIVAAVEQWMSLVDVIESGKENLQQSIALAKNKILDLAIKGKLVEKEGVWEEKTLGEVSVDSADGPFGSNLKREHYTLNKEVRIIQLSNIGEEGWRDENTKYTTFEHLPNIARSEVHPGDIVIAKMMPAGRAILCPSIDKKYVLSSDAVKFVLKDGLYHKYVLYAINSSYFREQVYGDVQGVTRVRTSLKKLREYTIPLPPLSEQRRIVAKVEEIFAQLDNIAQALK